MAAINFCLEVHQHSFRTRTSLDIYVFRVVSISSDLYTRDATLDILRVRLPRYTILMTRRYVEQRRGRAAGAGSLGSYRWLDR
jgi:hypothetical protein